MSESSKSTTFFWTIRPNFGYNKGDTVSATDK